MSETPEDQERAVAESKTSFFHYHRSGGGLRVGGRGALPLRGFGRTRSASEALSFRDVCSTGSGKSQYSAKGKGTPKSTGGHQR